jgi:hypothetical protein
MRFEAKHQFGKELAPTVQNFKNICKTIAERTQIELAHSLISDKLFTSDYIIANCTSSLLSSLEPKLIGCITEAIGLAEYDEVAVATGILIGHYQFKPGSCAVLRCEEAIRVFGQLCVILSVGNRIYFVCKEFKTLSYVAYFHSFSVEASNTHSVLLSSDVKDYHHLGVHKISFLWC